MRSKRSKKRSKFASLNKHLAPTTPPPQQQQQQQAMEDDNDSQQVACLLEENTEAGGGATITDLFGNSSASSSSAVIDEVLSPASPSGLARRALRGRERWVFCRSSSPVTQSQSQWCVDVWSGVQQQQGLQLKLDYDEILSSWSDRGSLYIHGEGPQVVPQLPGCGFEDDNAAPSVFVEVGNGSGWRVPEMEVEVEAEGKERGAQGDKIKIKINREERVMRYKAKRQSRLFAKRIRYQVRKLNAEKRPRIKGRFVKRVEDMTKFKPFLFI